MLYRTMRALTRPTICAGQPLTVVNKDFSPSANPHGDTRNMRRSDPSLILTMDFSSAMYRPLAAGRADEFVFNRLYAAQR